MIKKITLVALLAGAFNFSNLNAQQLPHHCKTVDKINELKSLDPSLEERKQKTEQGIQNWIANNSTTKVKSVLVIPVVVHVLYRNTLQNIPDARIQLQIDLLNKDYRKLNGDTLGIPAAFKSFASDCEIEFCLAKRDDFGNTTTGITRKQVSIKEIGNTNKYYQSSQGGEAIWNRNHYLNFWVCEIDSMGGTLGFSTVPDYFPAASSDGVVIDYRYFGTSTNTHYNKGRTATHEVGHWLNLQHIWGDDFGFCSADDFVSDTPLQTMEHYGLPSFPSLDSCSSLAPGTMFMNYMDYTDDNGMFMFTVGQKQRIWAALTTTFRDSLFNSKGCLPVGIDEPFGNNAVKIHPNPTQENFNLSLELPGTSELQIEIFDRLGKRIYKDDTKFSKIYSTTIDLSNYAPGLYFLKLNVGSKTLTKKIIKE